MSSPRTRRPDPWMTARLWIAENPEAWTAIKAMARECVERRKHFSIRWLVEVARYELAVRQGHPYKVDNRMLGPLARLLVEQVPSCKDLIEMRDGRYVRREPAGRR